MPDSALDLTHARRALVIDDEGAVRGVLRRWLKRKGWEVAEASDGAAAMSRLGTHDGHASDASYDLVICDLRMPAFSGPELHAWAVEHRPDLLRRIVFASGDVQEPAAADFLQRTGCPVLEKPFELARLDAVLSAVVGPS
jgi:two-component system NtrC family sensor kinase